MISASNPGHILGYHGCDRDVAESVLSGEGSLFPSTNEYDWLGNGIYFWEDNPQRAEKWANDRTKMPGSTISEPYVVGAVIDPGHSFSLLRSDHLSILQIAYEMLKDTNERENKPMPQNRGGNDRFLRALDCAVIQTLHAFLESKKLRSIDSIRGLFQEGLQLYPGSDFHEASHIQICVKNPECIKGYFRATEL